MPTVQCALAFHELLRMPKQRALCLTTTAYAACQQTLQLQEWRELHEHFTDARFGCAVLSNENSIDMWVDRQPHMSVAEHQLRLVITAATWLSRHLGGRIPIKILAVDEAEAANLQSLIEHGEANVTATLSTLADYVVEAWSQDQETLELYQALAEARLQRPQDGSQAESSSEFGYTTHLPFASLEAGVKSRTLVRGTLHVVPSGSVAYARTGLREEDDGELEADVLIGSDADRNRAVHGDVVAVQLHTQDKWPSQHRRSGRVVGILRSGWRDYVATIQASDVGLADADLSSTTAAPALVRANLPLAGKVLAVPMDVRAPKVRIATRDRYSHANMRLVVRIDAWPIDSHWPQGHIARVLGPIGDLETETQALLLEHGLRAPPFTSGQLAEMPLDPQGWRPEPAEEASRRDLRTSRLLFSIDPRGCEDVDDVLGVRELNNGETELSVHIADVAHFIRPGMLTDAEARSRATTVYLVDRRYDMLPAALSGHVCSLHDGVDRYAVSVMWRLDKDANVLDTWMGRTLIRSRYKLHYELAQALADTGAGAPGAGSGEGSRATLEAEAEAVSCLAELRNVRGRTARDAAMQELRSAIRLLMATAIKLQHRRADRGGLRLESDELRVQLDPKRQDSVAALLPKHELPIHGVVAECMILANEAVAACISAARAGASVLRHHPLPVQEQFGELRRLAATQGVEIDTSSNRALAASLDRAARLTDPATDRIMRQLATAAMNEAAYFNTADVDAADWFHYGLGLEVYTHFTSPIRRYADVLVHRTLHAVLAEAQRGQSKSDRGGDSGAPKGTERCDDAPLREAPTPRELTALCENINVKNRASKLAQRASVEFFQALYYRRLLTTDAARDAWAGPVVPAHATVVQLLDDGVVVYVAAQEAGAPPTRPASHLFPRTFTPGLKMSVRLPFDDVTKTAGGKKAQELTFEVPTSLFSAKIEDRSTVTGCRVVSHVDHIEIVCAQGRAKVHLLAKVEIGIQVLNSRYRPPCVSCVLLRTLPELAEDEAISRKAAHASVVAEVLADEKAKKLAATSERKAASRKPAREETSLYSLLQGMADLALYEDDAAG